MTRAFGSRRWLNSFSFGGHLVGFILVGKVFKKTFRTSGLDERKGNGTRFSWKFSGQCYTFFLAFSPVSLTDIALILVWSLHSAQGSGQTCP